ncbi:ABC transporter permease [Staphylococcus chromogenes]|nr:ABC transporter permease [Staphylococcus chromogenes]
MPRLLSRIGQALIVLLCTYALAFVLLTALPGDGVEARYANPQLGLSQEQIAEIRTSYGYDKPAVIQFFLTFGKFLTGDLGYSVQSGTKVTELLSEAVPNTLTLATFSFALALLLALLIAVLAASSAKTLRWTRGLPPAMTSMPSFLIGILLIQFISFQLGLIPVFGASDLQRLILPVLTLSVPIAAPLAQVLIRSMDEVYQQPFITVVRARGASENWLLFRNVLRGAMLPTLTIAGLLFGELVGGSIVTEAVFGRSGIGTLTVEAIANRDTPVLLALVVIAASVYILINLLVDLAYPILDPRLRRKA